MSHYPHLIQRVFDTPLMILESKLQTILTVLGPRAEFSVETNGDLTVSSARGIHVAPDANHKVGWSKSGHLTVNRLAILDVMGTLVQRCGGMEAASGLCSYESLSGNINTLVADNDVDAILMIIDSPGGEATSGVFDLADQIYQARQSKPIYAYAHDLATSAAYLIGSAASELYLPETGAVGSIGVVTAHLDISKKAEKEGVAMTYIYAGRYKIEGNPFEPLTDRVKAKVQERINSVYSMFTSRVARNRNLSKNDVIDTEADVYHGEDAVTMGLADGVLSFDQYLNRLLAVSNRNHRHHEVKHMSEQDNPPALELLDADQINERYPDAAIALLDRGAEAERQRISGILQNDHAEGRQQLAEHLAFNTDMTVEDAASLLAASPKQVVETASAPSPFETAMNAIENPDIGAGHDSIESTPQALAASIVEAARKAGSIQ